jgi:hypothetical protein
MSGSSCEESSPAARSDGEPGADLDAPVTEDLVYAQSGARPPRK